MRKSVLIEFAELSILLLWWQFHSSRAAVGLSKFDLKEGQEQYTLAIDRSKHPTYGACWLRVVDQLRTDCDRLTADVQRRLAFRFANCFLETSGMSTYSCSESEQDLNKCIKRMKDRDFSVYTAFFTHTANMCFFLSSQLWNLETEGTINRLVDASSTLTSGMESTLRLQQEWMENDKEHRKEISLAMESSRTTALDLFQQIVRIRETIFSDLACIYTVVFYFFCTLFSFLVTSAKRTEAARFWLFCLFMAAMGLEYFTIDRHPGVEFDRNLEAAKLAYRDGPETLLANLLLVVSPFFVFDAFYLSTWFIRKVSICGAVVILGMCIYKYNDLNKLNYQLMKDTNEQIHALNKYMIETRMLTATSNGINGIQRCNGTTLAPCVPIVGPGIKTQQRNPSYVLSSDDETFSGGESDRSATFFSDSNGISKRNGLRSYARQKKSSSHGSDISPSCPYNLRNRNQLSSPDTNMLRYESPEMFSAAVHRLADSTQKQAAALRRVLMERRLKEQDYEY